MKFRLAALLFLFALVLSACSMSEDITPPPGYKTPTPIPTLTAEIQTPSAASTKESAVVTPETSPVSTQGLTKSINGTATGIATLGSISGVLVNGSGGVIQEGQKVSLFGFDKDQSGNYQKALQLDAAIDSKGNYGFKDVETPQERVFLIITSWGGVEYQSDPVVVSNGTNVYSIPITIYEKTNDLNLLTFNQVHLIFDQASPDNIQVTELFIATNPSKQVVVVPSDGTTIPFIHTPEKVGNLQFQLSQGSTQLLNATGGFAMLPGADKQYGFIASYTLPYGNSLKFSQPFSLPVSSLTVFIPKGMRLRGEQLTDAGPQDIQGKSYQLFQANNMVTGSSLTLTLSGKPGGTTGTPISRQTWVLIGISVVGILLIGLGIYLYLRDLKRLKREDEANLEDVNKDALGDDRDSIMDAMITLDDQYKAGEIPKEAYEQRRMELKGRLKELL
jgi:hypothetical protein